MGGEAVLKVLLGRGGTDIGSEGERRRPSRSQPWADPSHRRRSTWRPTFLRLQAARGQRAGAPSTLLARRSGCRGHRSGIARQRRARAPSRRRVGERRPRIIRHRRGGHLHNGQHDARRKRHRTSSAGQEPSAFGGNKSALSRGYDADYVFVCVCVCLCVYSRVGASCVGRPTCVCAVWAPLRRVK